MLAADCVNARVVIMEPLEFLGESLHLLIKEKFPTINVVAVATSLREVEIVARDQPFDLLISEMYGEKESFFDWHHSAQKIFRTRPYSNFVLWTNTNKNVIKCFNLNRPSMIVIPKSLKLQGLHEKLTTAFNYIYRNPRSTSNLYRRTNRNKFTRQEVKVIIRIMQGEDVPRIANQMSIGIKTVSSHKCSAMRKMGVRNNAELFNLWRSYVCDNLLDVSSRKI